MTRPFSSIPDGHGTVTLYRHVERGDPAVVAVRRDTPADPQHLAAPPALDPDVYDLLAAVADPGEAVVERVADALFEWNTPANPYFVIRGRDGEHTHSDDPYEPIVRAVLAALREVDRG